MQKPRIAVLTDLPREASSGGHVKYWERVAQAAVRENAPVDLTLYFSGSGPDEILSPHVRFRFLPPVFSTARLKFLPYVPAHTDLASYHPRLAQELVHYEVIHTTDAFFAFARTAERVARLHNIPLVTSLHTDTPAYAEFFTRQTLQGLFGAKFGGSIDTIFRISKFERARKEKRLETHLRACAAVMAMRDEDIALVRSVTSSDKIKPMRLGVDKDLFAPNPHARAEVMRDYEIGPGRFLVLFVGRVDAGKNIPLLIDACAAALQRGVPIHLLVVGLGPMGDTVKARLGPFATLVGQLKPQKLARLYAAVDCLAIASDIEIGGLVGLEALSCGCPVLVSRQSGVAQLCGDTPAMEQVESDATSWASALLNLAHDKTAQDYMRDSALTFRRDHLAGWNDVLNGDFIPVWQSLAGQETK